MNLKRIESAADNMAALLDDITVKARKDLKQAGEYNLDAKYLKECVGALYEMVSIVSAGEAVVDVRAKDDPIERAIAHYQYGIDCDIFSEPVTTYAQTAIEALTFYKDRDLYIKAPMKMTEWLKQELTVHCYNRCMEEL